MEYVDALECQHALERICSEIQEINRSVSSLREEFAPTDEELEDKWLDDQRL